MILRDRSDLRPAVGQGRVDAPPRHAQISRRRIGRECGASAKQAARGVRLIGVETECTAEFRSASHDELGQPPVVPMPQRVSRHEDHVDLPHRLTNPLPDLVVGTTPLVRFVTVGKPMRARSQ